MTEKTKQRYVALDDVSVHEKLDPGTTWDESTGFAYRDSYRATLLAPGESVAEDELSDHEVRAFEEGLLGSLLVKVDEAEAAKLLEQAGDARQQAVADLVAAGKVVRGSE